MIEGIAQKPVVDCLTCLHPDNVRCSSHKVGCQQGCKHFHANAYDGWICVHPKNYGARIREFVRCSKIGLNPRHPDCPL
jgi:hypothetical protein